MKGKRRKKERKLKPKRNGANVSYESKGRKKTGNDERNESKSGGRKGKSNARKIGCEKNGENESGRNDMNEEGERRKNATGNENGNGSVTMTETKIDDQILTAEETGVVRHEIHPGRIRLQLPLWMRKRWKMQPLNCC